MTEPCEWNPGENRPANTGDEPHGEAVWSVGGRKNWHLCETCAALLEFKRMTKRKRIERVD